MFLLTFFPTVSCYLSLHLYVALSELEDFMGGQAYGSQRTWILYILLFSCWLSPACLISLLSIIIVVRIDRVSVLGTEGTLAEKMHKGYGMAYLWILRSICVFIYVCYFFSSVFAFGVAGVFQQRHGMGDEQRDLEILSLSCCAALGFGYHKGSIWDRR